MLKSRKSFVPLHSRGALKLGGASISAHLWPKSNFSPPRRSSKDILHWLHR